MLKRYKENIYAISLEKDRVIPVREVIRTLQGEQGKIGIQVDTFDFSYPYCHENPFFCSSVNRGERDQVFGQVFQQFGSFLRN
jgi:hypothetical protein